MDSSPETTTNRRRFTPGRLLAGVAIAICVVVWVLALSGWGKKDSPDLLKDKAWKKSATPICADAHDTIESLPNASEAANPQQRSLQVVAANEAINDMLTKLRALRVGDDADRRTLDDWFSDWDRHLKDRRAYAEDLANGARGAFTETTRLNQPLSKIIDRFANTNGMAECATPDDV